MEEKQNRHYISTKVHPIFESILVDILMAKPDDVVILIHNKTPDCFHVEMA